MNLIKNYVIPLIGIVAVAVALATPWDYFSQNTSDGWFRITGYVVMCFVAILLSMGVMYLSTFAGKKIEPAIQAATVSIERQPASTTR